MQTALRALSSINGANVAVTAGDPSGWVVEFHRRTAHTDVEAITGDGTNLVGDVKDVTVNETVKGNAATVDVTEAAQGHLATVNVTETQKGDAGFTHSVAKVADASGAATIPGSRARGGRGSEL